MTLKNPLLAIAVASWPFMIAAQNDTPSEPAPEVAPDAVVEADPVAPVLSREEQLEQLLAELANKNAQAPDKIDERIRSIWSQSGSASADLLLQRGREALNAENYVIAVEHFTALTDHAPDFAEGWNMRATAFFQLDQFGLSLSDVERTLALNPRHYGALAGMGIMLEQMNDPESALVAYRAAQAINPHRDQVNEAVERLAYEVEGRTL